MPAAFVNWKNGVAKQETAKNYIFEIATTDGDVHYVDGGAYGKDGGQIVSLTDECGDGIKALYK